MNKKTLLKKAIATLLTLTIVLSSSGVFASILGSSKIDGYSTKIGEGLFFTHNVFFSDQNGVGQQTENYMTYTPNSSVIPSITYGSALYGTSTLTSETSRLENLGIDILGGTNADFFSFQTGVPMSNAIIDGKIVTKDSSGQEAIGILDDGTAFISKVFLYAVLKKEDGTEMHIHNINKYRQPYSSYMLTRDFSETTKNTTSGYDIILGSVEGEMKLGTTMTAVVESVTLNNSSIPIPEDKLVITVDANAPEEILTPFSTLKEGEQVSIRFSAQGDSRWNDVKVGMGAFGGRLLTNGEVNPNLEAGAAPRTAIGLKEDGTIILYTIDGRQSGHSYGVQLKTLASRLKELGCIDALNFDGGGSTAISVQMPGNSSANLINKPSEGKERSVSTYFLFTNTEKRTGTAAHLHLYPLSNYILKGAQLQLELKATDKAFYPADVPDDVVYSVQEGKESTVTQSGLFTAKDNSIVAVNVSSGEIKSSTAITCLETPTDITVNNKATGDRLTEITLKPGEKISLSADAYGGYNKLISSPDCFNWECDEGIGSLNQALEFTATDKFSQKGSISVSAGKKTVTIPVTTADPDSTDPASYPVIDMSFKNGKLDAVISCKYNISTFKDGIILKADGKPTDFTYNASTGKLSAILPKSTQKITLIATNEFGYTSFKSTISGNTAIFTPFADTKGHWAEKTLNYMYSQKIINGSTSDGVLKFNPNKDMTRSEFAVMMVNSMGINANDYAKVSLPYSDIKEIPSWALNSFKALYHLNILKGRYVSPKETRADPLASISRAEAATIVSRTLPGGFYKTKITSTDKSDIASWAESGISVMLNIGAMKGYEDGSLKPAKALTKAEAAKILYSTM